MARNINVRSFLFRLSDCVVRTTTYNEFSTYFTTVLFWRILIFSCFRLCGSYYHLQWQTLFWRCAVHRHTQWVPVWRLPTGFHWGRSAVHRHQWGQFQPSVLYNFDFSLKVLKWIKINLVCLGRRKFRVQRLDNRWTNWREIFKKLRNSIIIVVRGQERHDVCKINGLFKGFSLACPGSIMTSLLSAWGTLYCT